MPLFYDTTENEIRNYCRETIESLEVWLRRVIDHTLRDVHGPNYFDAVDEKGDKVIKKEIRDKAIKRKTEFPDRYPRLVDTLLLDNEIELICNQRLYERYFKPVLHHAFPQGWHVAKVFMDRLIEPRNKLSHANPISVREAERIICYSNDIIDSIKEYYRMNGQEKEFNVPSIIRFSDSLGNVYHQHQFLRYRDCHVIQLNNDKKNYLRSGERLSLEIEVDPSFAPSDYTLEWYVKGALIENTNQTKYTISLENRHVSEIFQIGCSVRSNEEYHRFENGFDDYLSLHYKVLPPVR